MIFIFRLGAISYEASSANPLEIYPTFSLGILKENCFEIPLTLQNFYSKFLMSDCGDLLGILPAIFFFQQFFLPFHGKIFFENFFRYSTGKLFKNLNDSFFRDLQPTTSRQEEEEDGESEMVKTSLRNL